MIYHPGGTDCIEKNEIFIINPGQVHSCGCERSGHSYKIISVLSQIMQAIASQISEKQENVPYFEKIHYKDNLLSIEIKRLLEVIGESESDIQVESELYSFLSCLILNFSESPPLISETGEQKDSIKRVCYYINHNFSKQLSLKKLAEIACLSPFHFQREFKKRVGITPHEYLNDFRISKSKNMLLDSCNIADIAVQLGFFDQSHFSKTFKKTVGISPGNYIKINRMR
jgi:AraC-like DNA-binding protein